MDEALDRARARLADQPAMDAALERARTAVEALAQTTAELEAGLPVAIQDGLKEHFRPSARHLAEVRGLMNNVVRRLESLETDLLAERHARVDDLSLLVDVIASGWEATNARLASIEQKLDQPRLRSVS
ncbi:MAG: hypothetical protein ACYDA3_01100 [Gaiellaceae bacterium]